MKQSFGQAVAQLSREQRLRFYEQLANELTVAIRFIWSEFALTAEEKVEQMKCINELLHQTIAKIRMERLQTHEWLDTDFENLILHWAGQNLSLGKLVDAAIQRSYEYALKAFTDE